MDRVRVERVVALYAAAHGLSVGELLAWDRRRHVVRARWCVMFVLGRMGCSRMEIARVLGVDHSTVCHGLEVMEGCGWREQREVLRVLVAEMPELVGLLGPGVDAALWWVAPVLRRLVRAYVMGVLLGRERYTAPEAMRGLWVVCGDRRVWRAVVGWLEGCELGVHVGRMEAHARAVGWPVPCREVVS